LVSKRRLDMVLLATLLMIVVPTQLLVRHHAPSALDPDILLYLYALALLAVALLAAFLLKHDHGLGSLLCNLGLTALVLVLFLPHDLFQEVPLFSLCWLGAAFTWLTLALWLDRVPLLSAGGHQYPDVALEEGWQLGTALFRFYQQHEHALFHAEGSRSPLAGFVAPSRLFMDRHLARTGIPFPTDYLHPLGANNGTAQSNNHID